jgi:hypothetical protein
MSSKGQLMELLTGIETKRPVRISTRRLDPPLAGDASSALEAANRLNSLRIADRKYAVIRDTRSRRFVIAAVHQTTGAILDQFAPEQILKMVEQLSRLNGNSARITGEMKA